MATAPPSVRLRPLTGDDLPALTPLDEADNPYDFFGFTAPGGLARRIATDGGLSEESGTLVVTTDDGTVIGTVGWKALWHGPSQSARALNIGIGLRPEHRGRGYGTAAQDAIARYLFRTTLVERLEASTDVENLAEQRALEKARFTREGVLRHAQFRSGAWHDLALFSRLRGD